MTDLTRSRAAVATMEGTALAEAPAKAFNVRSLNHIAIRVTIDGVDVAVWTVPIKLK